MESDPLVVMEGRSLAETPTWSVASVTTVMIFVCLFVERSIYRFGKWLKKTKRKALFAALEKIKQELMLLGLISLMLGQWAKSISEICIDSSLFTSRFYLCSEEDYNSTDVEHIFNTNSKLSNSSHTAVNTVSQHCSEGSEPFVSQEGLEQLHRFLFVLGMTHVLYSCVAVGLAMIKIYSWNKWECQASLQAKINKVLRRQSTFVFHHTSHPWSRNRVLIWMLCFLRQFRCSIEKSDYLALRQGFITKHKLPLSYDFHKYIVRSMEDEFHVIVGISWPLWGFAILGVFVNIHGLNIYFWLSFIPVILVMLVGTKLQHVVSLLALEIAEATGPSVTTQVKPRDGHFWFKKPEILLWLIQFISFQNSFEMATFVWALWGLKHRSCFMKNHVMVIVRLTSGILVQFWCSYSTVPLNIIVMQMGSRSKKALIAENVRELLHGWCKRVKQKSRRDSLRSHTIRSTFSLESILDDESVTVASGTLSRSSSVTSLNQFTAESKEQIEVNLEIYGQSPDHSLQIPEYSTNGFIQPAEEDCTDNNGRKNMSNDTLFELFKKT